jgi:hypothetical protein
VEQVIRRLSRVVNHRSQRVTDRMRRRIQRHIILRAIRDALTDGCILTVKAAGDVLAFQSTDYAAIKGAVHRAWPDCLLIYRPDNILEPGWVELNYDFKPWDVIHDFSSNVDDVVCGARAAARTLEAFFTEGLASGA